MLENDHWYHRHKRLEAWEMAPQGLALKHEASHILEDWEKFGCPTKTGRDWTLNKIQAAIDRGPHKSALEPATIAHFAEEVANKVKKGHARTILWDDIKENHLGKLKLSPVAAIPHKSRAYRSSWTYLLHYASRTAGSYRWSTIRQKSGHQRAQLTN